MEVKPNRRIEKFYEKLRRGAEARHVGGTEVVRGVGGEEIGEVARGRIGAEEDGGDALGQWGGSVAGGVRGIDRRSGRGDPVFGEMGIGRGRGRSGPGRKRFGDGVVHARRGGSEAVKFAAAEVGAPNAVRRKAKDLAVGSHAKGRRGPQRATAF